MFVFEYKKLKIFFQTIFWVSSENFEPQIASQQLQYYEEFNTHKINWQLTINSCRRNPSKTIIFFTDSKVVNTTAKRAWMFRFLVWVRQKPCLHCPFIDKPSVLIIYAENTSVEGLSFPLSTLSPAGWTHTSPPRPLNPICPSTHIPKPRSDLRCAFIILTELLVALNGA